jgi:glutamine phosphoribosylpyrophosphate amidotransferase
MLGYTLTGKPNMVQKELPIFSIRSLPSFENMDSPAAALSNVIGHAALDDKKRFDTVAVVVEKNQEDLHRYINFLNNLGIGVKRYSTTGNKNGGNTIPMPLDYETKLQTLFPENGIEVFQVNVQSIRDWIKNGIPNNVSQQVDTVHKDLAPALKETREALAKNNSQSNAWDLLITMLSCPPSAGSRRQIPREN